MINLRQLRDGSNAYTNATVHHSTDLTLPHFRVPTSRLGNIGEPLEYGDSWQFSEEDDSEIAFELAATGVSTASKWEESAAPVADSSA